ncbi:5'/3'-nucleotidase SurE [Marinilabiliaceae bacterium JC040]|nr:5'/3'-nucleotidase SurE [Marinilabiliaceae bacterium JC040]
MQRMTKHILVTNDDGIDAEGIKDLIDLLKGKYRLTIIAPASHQSGKSHSLTGNRGLVIKEYPKDNVDRKFSIDGTPVDCMKLGMHCIIDDNDRPDLVISGINRGVNASISSIYSGTIGAAREGYMYGIPSIGLSLYTEQGGEPNYRRADEYILEIIEKTLENFTNRPVCLNVNIPNIGEIKGYKFCRQTVGYWKEYYKITEDENGNKQHWLHGNYINEEPESTDTDYWAIDNNYISILPIQVDETDYEAIELGKEVF